jgi:hypothetical protein
MRAKRGMRFMAVAGFLAVLGLASGTRAQEEKIPLHRVPKTVLTSAKAKFPGSEIKKASKETEDGEPVFALEMKHHRHNVDVTLKVDGTVVLVETDVTAKEVPNVVLQAIQQSYPGATVRGAESVNKGPEVKKTADYYQLYLLTADERPALVKVDPDGKVLEPVAKTALRKRDGRESKRAEGSPADRRHRDERQVGHLGLTASEQADLVNFLKSLSDKPNPVNSP